MKKTYWLLLCILIWIATLMGCGEKKDAEARDETRVETHGSAGEDIVWNYKTGSGTLEFKGSGEMDLGGFSFDDYQITNVVFDNNITGISDSLLKGHSELAGELKLPDNLIYIGSSAFYGCSGINGELILPDTLISIGEQAFYDCENISGNIKIPSEIEIIPNGLFHNCKKISSVDFSGSERIIGEQAFYNCEGITGEVEMPEKLEIIGNEAFFNCKNISGNLELYEGLTTVGCGSFSGCEKVTELNLPESLLNIKRNAFEGCKGLTGNVYIPGNVESIGSEAFNHCDGINTVVFGAEVESIGPRVFRECAALQAIECLGILPDFYNQDEEEQQSLPDGCTIMVDNSNSTTRQGWMFNMENSMAVANGNFPDMEGAAEEDKYGCTKKLTDVYYGLGEYADTSIHFEDGAAYIYVNEGDYSEGTYIAASDDENTIMVKDLYVRRGYITKLKYIEYNQCDFIIAEVELPEGGNYEIVFTNVSEEYWTIYNDIDKE